MFVNATGSCGSRGDRSSNIGGRGGWVQALLQVSVGQTLYIYVGTTVFNGGGSRDSELGGSGGGATDIRTISGDLTSRIIVAGGGGGPSWGIRGKNGGAKMRMR